MISALSVSAIEPLRSILEQIALACFSICPCQNQLVCVPIFAALNHPHVRGNGLRHGNGCVLVYDTHEMGRII